MPDLKSNRNKPSWLLVVFVLVLSLVVFASSRPCSYEHFELETAMAEFRIDNPCGLRDEFTGFGNGFMSSQSSDVQSLYSGNRQNFAQNNYDVPFIPGNGQNFAQRNSGESFSSGNGYNFAQINNGESLNYGNRHNFEQRNYDGSFNPGNGHNFAQNNNYGESLNYGNRHNFAHRNYDGPFNSGNGHNFAQNNNGELLSNGNRHNFSQRNFDGFLSFANGHNLAPKYNNGFLSSINGHNFAHNNNGESVRFVNRNKFARKDSSSESSLLDGVFSYTQNDPEEVLPPVEDVSSPIPFRFPTSEEYSKLFKDSEEEYVDLTWDQNPKLSEFGSFSNSRARGQSTSEENKSSKEVVKRKGGYFNVDLGKKQDDEGSNFNNKRTTEKRFENSPIYSSTNQGYTDMPPRTYSMSSQLVITRSGFISFGASSKEDQGTKFSSSSKVIVERIPNSGRDEISKRTEDHVLNHFSQDLEGFLSNREGLEKDQFSDLAEKDLDVHGQLTSTFAVDTPTGFLQTHSNETSIIGGDINTNTDKPEYTTVLGQQQPVDEPTSGDGNSKDKSHTLDSDHFLLHKNSKGNGNQLYTDTFLPPPPVITEIFGQRKLVDEPTKGDGNSKDRVHTLDSDHFLLHEISKGNGNKLDTGTFLPHPPVISDILKGSSSHISLPISKQQSPKNKVNEHRDFGNTSSLGVTDLTASIDVQKHKSEHTTSTKNRTTQVGHASILNTGNSGEIEGNQTLEDLSVNPSSKGEELPVTFSSEEKPQGDMFASMPCTKGHVMDKEGRCRLIIRPTETQHTFELSSRRRQRRRYHRGHVSRPTS